jgi:hypothetical protein
VSDKGLPVSLFQGGRELPDDLRQKVQSDGTLVISPVQKATDAGVYTCSAKNKQGHSAKRSGEVTVIGKTLSACQHKWLFGFQVPLAVDRKANGRTTLTQQPSCPAIFKMCSSVECPFMVVLVACILSKLLVFVDVSTVCVVTVLYFLCIKPDPPSIYSLM